MYTAIPPKKEAQINSAPSAAVLSDLCDKALDPPRTIKSPMPRKPSSQGHDTRYTGPPGHCHGGIIATILDDAMGKVNKLRHVVALTREMTVEYLKPVPLHKQLRVEGREVQVRGRTHVNTAEIVNAKGEVLARSKGIFIAIDPEQMFAKYVER